MPSIYNLPCPSYYKHCFSKLLVQAAAINTGDFQIFFPLGFAKQPAIITLNTEPLLHHPGYKKIKKALTTHSG
ncbi:MAG TPA: hypothetical protein PLG09_02370, partial [Syntrophomonadaceae bacterium]|nr:hypothetical protein [Syntrophomonadaceae bacterium]